MDYPFSQFDFLLFLAVSVRPRACAYARAAVSAIGKSGLINWLARITPPITNRGVHVLSNLAHGDFYHD